MENEKNVAVFGIYPTRPEVEVAVGALRNANFTSSDVSVLFSSSSTTDDFAHNNSTKAPEGAATGALSGATVGGVLGWLAGIGSLAIPGVGPFIAAGPILGSLAGLGVGGAIGGIGGALIGLGVPEYEAKRYVGRINEGGILLSVHASDQEAIDKAKRILENTGAEDISTKDESVSNTSANKRETRQANY